MSINENEQQEVQVADMDLISRYMGGDEKALEELIARYLSPVHGFTLRYVGNVHDAEDLTQEIFLKVWRNIRRFDTTKTFTPWLYRIARNTVFDFFKKKKTVPFSALGEAQENFVLSLRDSGLSPEELLEQKEVGSALSVLREELTPAYQTVLQMRYKEDHTFQEIANILSEPLHTIKSRHRRALIKLRAFLDHRSLGKGN